MCQVPRHVRVMAPPLLQIKYKCGGGVGPCGKITVLTTFPRTLFNPYVLPVFDAMQQPAMHKIGVALRSP